MSAQERHTSSGMTPALMRSPNTLQPRHSPRADSKNAAVARRPTTTQVAVLSPKPNQSTIAVEENTTPMAWAKRFGGPGTSRG